MLAWTGGTRDERRRTLVVAIPIKHNRVILICLKVFTGSTKTTWAIINSTENDKTMQSFAPLWASPLWHVIYMSNPAKLTCEMSAFQPKKVNHIIEEKHQFSQMQTLLNIPSEWIRDFKKCFGINRGFQTCSCGPSALHILHAFNTHHQLIKGSFLAIHKMCRAVGPNDQDWKPLL